jgi:hypothetical protein
VNTRKREKSPRKIRLYEARGKESVTAISAELMDNGDLIVSGYDLGQLPQDFWREDSFEFWVTVPRKHKDHMLLVLIDKLYQGNPSAVSEFRELVKSTGIPHTSGTGT